jgi:hemoglobin
MPTIYDAVGGDAGLRRLAAAWHARVMDDEVVSHAFSHGFRPDHVERLAAYWGEALGGPPTYTATYGDETAVVRVQWSACTAATGHTRRWTAERSRVSTRRC